jgi:class 3 adenylate cyclase/DNA-binding winged helix-turn-helix (wHTH) protein/predicted ATPase
MLYRFADCELDSERAILRRAHTALKLQRRVFEVLLYLLEHRGHMVSKDDLAAQVWQAAITNTTIDACIREVRRAVGDSGRAQRIIATRYGFGYEFVAPVAVAAEDGAEAAERPGAAGPVPGSAPDPVLEAPEAASPAGAPGAPATPQAPPGEKKVVTVLCCGVQIVPRSSAEADLDTLHSQTGALYDLVQHEVSRYGGTVQPLTGQRFLAWFGAPVAQEDHAQRAMLAALGVQQRLSTAEAVVPLPRTAAVAVRSGLHTGDVAVGGGAAEQALAAVVMGETALLATALQAAAAPGTILCSAATARLVQGLVEVEPVPPLVLADRPTPVEVCTVRQRAVRQSAETPFRRRPLRQFVGRQQELATLRRRFQHVEAGRGQVVGMAGEPGIGKSRLLAEFHTQLRHRPVTYLEGRCLSYAQETPYRPMLDLLRQACGLNELAPPDLIDRQVRRALQALGLVPDAEAPYLLHLLGVPAGTARLPSLSPEELKARIYTTFWRLLRHMSQRHPLVLAIEDLHWIDATSDAMLTALVERLAGVPMLLVVTYRAGYHPPWLDKSYATQLSLPRLTQRDSLQIVRAILPSARIPDTLVQQILAKADGNPFFLEELTQTVAEHGDASVPLAMPDTIQAVLAARIDRLPSDEKHVLQAAAVIGKDISVLLLQILTQRPEEELSRLLGNLRAAELLYESLLLPDPLYTFKHVLTQEVAYQSLLQSTRQHYHMQLAQALTAQFPEVAERQPELLAHHFAAAGLMSQAADFWQRAGQRALEHSSYIEAVSHLNQGLEALASLPDHNRHVHRELPMQIALGRALMAIKGYGAPEVGYAYARARSLSRHMGDTPQRFSVMRGLAAFYSIRAEYQTAQELGQECLALAKHLRDPALLLRAHLTLGQILLFLGQYPHAHAHLTEGRALSLSEARASRVIKAVQDPQVTCCALLAPTLWLLGYADQALQRAHEAVSLAQELAHPFSLAEALIFAAVVGICTWNTTEVLRSTDTVMTLATEHGFPHWEAHAATYRGWALTTQGQGDEGMALMQRGQTLWRDIGGELARPWFLALLAEGYGHTGQTQAGLAVLEEALQVVEQNGERHYESELYRLQGELLLQEGPERNLDEVERKFRRSLDVARYQQAKALELRAAMSLSRLLQQQGQRAKARCLLVKTYEWFTEGWETPDLRAAKALLTVVSS